MAYKQLKMMCDLKKNGANSHKVTSMYAVVIHSIQLYLMNDGFDEHFASGVEQLHTLNKEIGTSFRFLNLVESYIPVFEKEWSINTTKCPEKECQGDRCVRGVCLNTGTRKVKAC